MGHSRISWVVGVEFASCYCSVQNLEMASRFLESVWTPPIMCARFTKCGIDLFEAVVHTFVCPLNHWYSKHTFYVRIFKRAAFLNFTVTGNSYSVHGLNSWDAGLDCDLAVADVGVHCHIGQAISSPYDGSVTLRVTQTVVSVTVMLVLPAACSVFVPYVISLLSVWWGPQAVSGIVPWWRHVWTPPSFHPERVGLTPRSVHTAPVTLPSGISS